MVDIDDRTLIERSLIGELTAEEHAEYQKRKQVSSAFRAEIKLQRELLANLEAHQKSELKNELKNIFEKIDTSDNKKSGLSALSIYSIAASVFLVLGITMVFNFYKTDHTTLFQKYYEPYPVEGMVRGETNPSEIHEVAEYYANGAYQEVVSIIEAQLSKGIYFERQMIFLGIAYLNLDNTKKAIVTLSEINAEQDFYLDAQWYLALSYIKNGDTLSAKDVLNKLYHEPSVYKSSIKGILEEIE